MKVLKFGGTSVGSVESLRNVKKIVESIEDPAIVVVSALGGLTDRLIAVAKNASAGDADFSKELEGFAKRHRDIINELVPAELQIQVTTIVDGLLKELGNLYLGVSLIGELPERTLDRIVSFGERMSSVIVSAIIDDVDHKDSLDFIKTERWMDRNIADRQLTEKLIKECFPMPLERKCVVGGFISRDRDTDAITNLGRGGSDYTAALIAAALDADLLEIWTDVDGFMTSDPRIIKDAQVIPDMTFVESMELCSFGAKVIYPPTIYPVFHKNIPIKILNTHNPSAPGTLITDNAKNLPNHVRGVSSVRGVSMLTITGKLSSNMPEINSRTYNAMARGGIPVLLVTQGADSGDFSISVMSRYAQKAMEILENEFAPELGSCEVESITRRDEMSVIAVVKEGIKAIEGLGARLCHTLHRNGLQVHGISDGISESTIAIIVSEQDAENALKYVHGAVIPSKS